MDVSELTFDIHMKSTIDNDMLYESYLTYKLSEFNFRDIFLKRMVKAEQEARTQGTTMQLASSEAVIHHFHENSRDEAPDTFVTDEHEWAGVEKTVKSWMLEKRKGIKVVLNIRFKRMSDAIGHIPSAKTIQVPTTGEKVRSIVVVTDFRWLL